LPGSFEPLADQDPCDIALCGSKTTICRPAERDGGRSKLFESGCEASLGTYWLLRATAAQGSTSPWEGALNKRDKTELNDPSSPQGFYVGRG
jgi:hypothetical protein